ncbi:PAS domain S-box-containing protein/diguanylate cyclase (GGDEF) domain-containing protein [Nitrosomonas marina]|uniref:PAS domain S-box-containing protein/diguanylate cyclase (GGDEF) domain-containing protein n=1 Tax=Nitrosomonas marina TaxID=917 RepID=A0A1I0B566_9PROT|nr:sensor domain-containing diguanylate cyclase [Nitrosomonas marina]SET01839.1 PAS domain S-box-containing protein/diguanylate cyclase (GGDEF) domain-containing protein [Nitrosomonas marina]
MNNQLHLHITRIVTLAAILFVIIVSTAFLFYTRTVQQNFMEKSIEQLFLAISNPAKVAAFLGNKELATEIVESLSKNDFISTAILTSVSGLNISSSEPLPGSDNILFFSLHNPFDSTERVGEIRIHPNQQMLNQYVKNSTLEQVFILLALVLLVAVLMLNLMHRVLTTPIQSIAASLHRIKPGETGQLICPQGHEHNEIGKLVADINKLLTSTRCTINQERKLRSQVENMEKHFRLIFERASAGIFLLDNGFYLTSSNQAFQKIAGIVEDERRKNMKQIYLPDLFYDSKIVHEMLRGIQKTGRQTACDLRLDATVNGEERWLHCLFSTVQNDLSETMIEGLVIDVTERTFQMERILYESEHDPLTRLFNRRAGMQLLEIMLSKARKSGHLFILMLIDLDGFKAVNDNFGHDVGDSVLVEIANRMQMTIRKEDVLIRMGGDEFIIAFAIKSFVRDEIDLFIDKLQSRFKMDIQVNNFQKVTIGSSIGIAVFPHDGDNIETLITNADSAMYQSKRSGKNCASYYLAA